MNNNNRIPKWFCALCSVLIAFLFVFPVDVSNSLLIVSFVLISMGIVPHILVSRITKKMSSAEDNISDLTIENTNN